MKCYYCDRTVSFTAQKHNGHKICFYCKEAILMGRAEAAAEFTPDVNAEQREALVGSTEEAHAIYESWNETAKQVVDVLMQQVRDEERSRAAEIINKRREYDCTCSCDCHGHEAPCITCKADLEVIEMIQSEESKDE